MRQEQVVCPPVLMTNKSAGCMLKACENQFQVGGHLTAPSECAKFVGISSASDAAATCRKLFEWIHRHVGPNVYTMHTYCLQHVVGLAKSLAALALDIVGPTFSLAKQFGV